MVDGAARAYAGGQWTKIGAGDALKPDMLVSAIAPARLSRGAEALDLAPGGELRLEGNSYTLARLFSGALDATAPRAPTPTLVFTTYAEVAASGATFRVVAEPLGSTIAVREGSVEVTDLATRETVKVSAGETLETPAGRGGAPLAAKPDEAAPAEAKNAAGAAPSEIVALDLAPTGAIQPPAKAAPRPAVGAAPAAKLDPSHRLAAATEALIERERFPVLDVVAAPWDEGFRWTETKDGVARSKPLAQVIAGLSGSNASRFWFLALLACLTVGQYSNLILESEGFGFAGGAALAALGLAFFVVVRDAFFRGAGAAALEPYLSICLASAFPLTALLGALFLKRRMSSPLRDAAPAIVAAPPGRVSSLA